MSLRNYLNLTDTELDSSVFRIMPVHRLLECCSGQLTWLEREVVRGTKSRTKEIDR